MFVTTSTHSIGVRSVGFGVVYLVHTIVEIKGRWQHREVPTNPLISAFSEPEY